MLPEVWLDQEKVWHTSLNVIYLLSFWQGDPEIFRIDDYFLPEFKTPFLKI